MTNIVLQWNINGIYSHFNELKCLIRKFSPLVICIQETHLAPDKEPKLRGFELYRSDYTGGRIACGGVCIYVHDSCFSKQVQINTNLQCVAAQVKLPHFSQPISICNIYTPNTTQSIPYSEADLTAIKNQLPSPFIIVGDFNAHNPLWGSLTRSNEGKEVERFILNHSDLNLLNTGEATHFNLSYCTESAIDLSFCSSSIYPDLKWSVTDDLCFSDHFPILLTHDFPVPNVNASNVPVIWNYDKADWSKFSSKIDFSFIIDNADSNTPPNVDQMLSDINTNILDAAKSSVPVKHIPPNRLPVPWWDEEVKQVIKARRKWLRKARRFPTIDNKIEFKKARAIARKTIKEKRSSSWNNFVSSIDHSTSSGEMFHKMNKLRGKYSPRHITALQDPSDPTKVYYDTPSIARSLALQYASVSSNDNYSTQFLNHKLSSEATPIVFDFSSNQDYNSPLTYPELSSALSTCVSKAAGSDGISFIFLKHLPVEALKKLLIFYNLIWRYGIFPKSWGEALIIPLLKPGKDRLLPLSYRPISLLNCSGKIMEKMVNKRLFWSLEKKNLLSPFQSGGRLRRSTMDNLVILENEVAKGFAQKEHTVAAFLDIQKAFDVTWRLKIIKTLESFGINGFMLKYLHNFLNNRKISVKCNGQASDKFDLQNGIVQGSSLSPLLFIVFMNDIFDIIKPPLKRTLFIDDLLIIARGKNMDIVLDRFQRTLDDVQKWSEMNGVTFSTDPGKSVCIDFHRLRKTVTPTLTLNGAQLKFAFSTKFLGLQWDAKMNWSLHVEYIKKRALNSLNALKMVSNKKWGVRRETLLNFYKSFILPIFDYGSIVYGSAKNHLLSKLNTIHHTGIRIATGALRTSPVVSLYVDSGIPPLTLRRSKLLMNYISKIGASPFNPVHDVLFSQNMSSFKFTISKPKPLNIRYKSLTEFTNHVSSSSFAPYVRTVPPWLNSSPPVDLSLGKGHKKNTPPVIYQQQFAETISTKYANHIMCFTDGSKTADVTSCAFSVDGTICSKRLNPIISIFSAELIAILLCLEAIKDYPSYQFLVASDSRSVLSALSNIGFTNPLVSKVYSCWELLSSNNKEVQFIWCPSHCGIRGNENVDEAARNPADPVQLKLCSPEDFKPLAASFVKKEWQDQWNLVPNTNKLKSIKPLIVNWNTSTQDNRTKEVVLTRMRIGHTRLTHSFLFTKSDPPTCSCGEHLSVRHILSCHRHDQIRSSLPHPPSLADDVEGVKSLFSYLQKIDIYHLI
ncbi:hypothetical protein M8J77_024290 [Diaphorina citri]|nr:hypothetical protein M8J77_024290 [Diaphorina citri]